MALILDTGPLYAALDRRDSNHDRCRLLLESSQEELIIPLPVLAEVDYFIHERAHPQVRLDFLADILEGAYRIEGLFQEDFERIWELCAQYADADIGFVDAAVFAITERLNETKLVTLDRKHFGFLRPRHATSLLLLP